MVRAVADTITLVAEEEDSDASAGEDVGDCSDDDSWLTFVASVPM
jgi:hypothetical protein